ncbi:MAG TPA: acyl-CoA thioesterase [Cyclobacteriaceae bacterium]|nr:acyl-CoA thioesterase [Cyclobacteriaceae bacterium]
MPARKSIPHDRQVYTQSFQVSPDDIDELNHVNNVVYLEWVQSISYNHWETAASEELKGKCKWVVLRHEIDYHSPALPEDTIDAFTWIDAPEGPRQKRHVLIQRSSDGKVLATALTTWCLLDPQSGRPKRIFEEISSALGLEN